MRIARVICIYIRQVLPTCSTPTPPMHFILYTHFVNTAGLYIVVRYFFFFNLNQTIDNCSHLKYNFELVKAAHGVYLTDCLSNRGVRNALKL